MSECRHTLDDRENAVMADGYCPPCMAAEITRLRAVEDAARDLTALWQAQKISGLSRSDRNAAIEESREILIGLLADPQMVAPVTRYERALVEIEHHSTDKNAAATARAALASQPRARTSP